MPSAPDQRLLHALENPSLEIFLGYVSQHLNKRNAFKLDDLLCKISERQLPQLCDSVAEKTQQNVEILCRHHRQDDMETLYPENPSIARNKGCSSSQDSQSNEGNEGARSLSSGEVGNGTEAFVSNGCTDSVQEAPSQERDEESQQSADPPISGPNLQRVHTSKEQGKDTASPSIRKEAEYLKGLLIIINFLLSKFKESGPSSSLLSAVQSLHSSLLQLDAEPSLQEMISRICETWWAEKLPARETLVTQTVPYLLMKALHGRAADVKRVFALRSAIDHFDFEDESIGDLKNLLLRCACAPSFLRCSYGNRFLAHVMVLDMQLVREMTVLIKNQIPSGRKSILDIYGKVLFRGWRSAKGRCLAEIEYGCIQVFCEAAVYASSPALAASLRQVLKAFSEQKKVREVDEMLLRVNEPFLFRSLQVANPHVRQNALLLLSLLFPLHNPDASLEQNENLQEKQYTLFSKLLMDPSVNVRILAIKEVCNTMELWWTLLPPNTTAGFLSTLVHELAQDVANSNIRLAVLEGISLLLENPLTHSVLRPFLPSLALCLGDVALKVRVAAARLLSIVREIRTIKFDEVIYINSLLQCLATDEPAVARLITNILTPTYFPYSFLSFSDSTERFLVLLNRSPSAGAKFSRFLLQEGVPLETVLELITFLCQSLLSSNGRQPASVPGKGKKKMKKSVNGGESGFTYDLGESRNLKKVARKAGTSEGEFSAGGQGSEKDKITQLDPREWQNALLDALLGLCEDVSKRKGPETLETVIDGETAKLLLTRAKSPKSRTLVLKIAACLPPAKIPALVAFCGQEIMGYRGNVALTGEEGEEVKAILSFVVAWGGLGDFLAALSSALKSKNAESSPDSTSNSCEHSPPITEIESGNDRGKKRKKGARDGNVQVGGTEGDQENSSSRKEGSRRKKQQRSNGGLARGDTDDVVDVISAEGASRYVEMLLMETSTRTAMLEKNAECEKLLKLLRTAVMNVFVRMQGDVSKILHRPQAEGKSERGVDVKEVGGGGLMLPASPVLAYVKLAMHLAIQQRENAETEREGNGENGRGNSNEFGVEWKPVEVDEFEESLEEVVYWAQTALRTILLNPIVPQNVESPQSSDSPRREPPCRRPTRNSSRSRGTDQFQSPTPETDNSESRGNGKLLEERVRLRRQWETAVIFAGTLSVVTDAVTMGLKKKKASILEFAQQLIKWFGSLPITVFAETKGISSTKSAKRRSSKRLALRKSGQVSESSHHPWPALLSSSLSHAAKLVQISTELEQRSSTVGIATEIMNFLANVDSKKWDGSARILAVLRLWLPSFLPAALESNSAAGKTNPENSIAEFGSYVRTPASAGREGAEVSACLTGGISKWVQLLSAETIAACCDEDGERLGEGVASQESPLSSQVDPLAHSEDEGSGEQDGLRCHSKEENLNKNDVVAGFGTSEGGRQSMPEKLRVRTQHGEKNRHSHGRVQDTPLLKCVIGSVMNGPKELQRSFASYLIGCACEADESGDKDTALGATVLVDRVLGVTESEGGGEGVCMEYERLVTPKQATQISALRKRSSGLWKARHSMAAL